MAQRAPEASLKSELAKLRKHALAAGEAEVVQSADRLLAWIARTATDQGWRAKPELVSIGDAMRLTGRSRNTIKRWVDRELLTGFRNPTNRELFVPRDQLMRLVNLSSATTERPGSRAASRRAGATDHNRHREAEVRSLEMHRRIADRIRRDPAVLKRALERTAGWLDGSVSFAGSRSYAERWHELLTGPRAQLVQMLTGDDEAARALRQSSPFAGTLSNRELLDIRARAAPGNG